MPDSKGKMSVKEAGRIGGSVTAERYGRAFYEEIGEKGGKLGGPKGGQTTKQRYGKKFYKEIGRKGGNRVRELVESGKASLASEPVGDEPIGV